MFKDDLTYDIGKLKPLATDLSRQRWQAKRNLHRNSHRVRSDLNRILCPKSGDLNYMFDARNYDLDCWSFIPNENMTYIHAVFKDPPSGIPDAT